MIERESGCNVRARDSQNKRCGGRYFHDKLCCVWGILWHLFCRYVTCSLLCSRCPSPSMLSINWCGKRKNDHEKDGVNNQLTYLLMRSWMSTESMSNCVAQIPETLSSRPHKVDMCLLKYPLNKSHCCNDCLRQPVWTHTSSVITAIELLCVKDGLLQLHVKKQKEENHIILTHSHKEADDYNTRWLSQRCICIYAAPEEFKSERAKLSNGEGPLKGFLQSRQFI